MALLIGTDEAGYGPNLGPLVIAATVWRVPEKRTDLGEVLQDFLGGKPDQIQLADSKSVFKSGSGSIEALEKSAQVLLNLGGEKVATYSELHNKLADLACNPDDRPFWNCDSDFELPLEACQDSIERISRRVDGRLGERGIMLEAIRIRVLFPDQFNDGVQELGNKATLLSTETLKLIAQCMSEHSTSEKSAAVDDVHIYCDKHGGRSRYLPLIGDYLTDEFVQVLNEGLQESSYRWSFAGASRSVEFLAKGERLPAIAAASIIAKYVRQIYMKVWNGFWQSYLPDLKATAGYPVDAKRFKTEIARVQDNLGIADNWIWRIR